MGDDGKSEVTHERELTGLRVRRRRGTGHERDPACAFVGVHRIVQVTDPAALERAARRAGDDGGG